MFLKEIYFDNSATTVVCPQAALKIMEVLTKNYANPSSLHKKGMEAEKELRKSREIIADKLHCQPREIYFTSGGTEANNLALFGAARKRRRMGNRIVTTLIEHSSVLESAKQLEQEGFEVVYLTPDKNGSIPVSSIEEAINEKTILVSMMLVNNEIGSVLPVELIKKVIKRKKSPALFHVDAVQAFGKLEVNPKKIGADLTSITAHKIHGPKGVGALYVRSDVKILPLFYGGEQEKKLRPGTEALPLIAGFSEAVRALPDWKKEYNEIKMLYDQCRKRLTELPGITVHSREDGFAYILNFSAKGIRSETMLHYLAERGISVSSGSACAKGKKSHVLEGIGLDRSLIDSAIRVSFSRYNRIEEIPPFVDAVLEGIRSIAKK